MNLTHVDVVYVLLYDWQEDRVLMVENETFWSLPGGKREHGEMLNAAAIREAKEETGLDVRVSDIVHISEKVVNMDHVTFLTFRGEITGGMIGTTDNEIQQVAWKSVEEAEELMPYLGDIRKLLERSAMYLIQRGK